MQGTHTPAASSGNQHYFFGLKRIAFALLIATTGCTTFRGPGALTLSGEQQSSLQLPGTSTEMALPRYPASVALGGARIATSEQGTVSLDWPVDEARLTRGFLAAQMTKGSRKKKAHLGLDLANKKGTPIMAAERGTVVYTGNGFHGYGKLIVIEHNNDWATLYSHLDKILVKEGQSVAKGENIAKMGRTGHATGVHLHFEVRHFRQPVNPLAYLPQESTGTFANQPHAHSLQLSSRAMQLRQQSEE